MFLIAGCFFIQKIGLVFKCFLVAVPSFFFCCFVCLIVKIYWFVLKPLSLWFKLVSTKKHFRHFILLSFIRKLNCFSQYFCDALKCFFLDESNFTSLHLCFILFTTKYIISKFFLVSWFKINCFFFYEFCFPIIQISVVNLISNLSFSSIRSRKPILLKYSSMIVVIFSITIITMDAPFYTKIFQWNNKLVLTRDIYIGYSSWGSWLRYSTSSRYLPLRLINIFFTLEELRLFQSLSYWNKPKYWFF